MSRVERSRREKVTRYSVRKVSFGAASVAVAAFFMFLGNGAVYAAEPNVTATDSALAATPANNQLDENSGASDSTAPKGQADTTTPAPADASSTSVESSTVSKVQADATTSKPADATPAPVVSSTTSTTEEKLAEKNTEASSAEANSVENKEQTTVKAEEKAATPVTESNKPKSRKRRAADTSSTAPNTTSDEAANQVFETPNQNVTLEELSKKLQGLPSKVENNSKLQNMDKLGEEKSLKEGTVAEINEFGGWTSVNGGVFAIARKTIDGVFPLETINSTLDDKVWLREQAFDRSSQYILLLSKSRTRANKDALVKDNSQYRDSNEGSGITKNVVGFNGIEKTFKAYSKEHGSSVVVKFKTGYAGDSEGYKANYKVEVFSIVGSTEKKVYETTFDPSKNYSDQDKIVTKASDGTNKEIIRISETSNGFVQGQTKTRNKFIGKEQAEKKIAEASNIPNGKSGTFTSKNIVLDKGVEKYKVRVSLADENRTGMSYQAWDIKYSLPISGLDFTLSQDTRDVAKDLLTRVYNKLKETEASDVSWRTDDSKAAYEEQLAKIQSLISGSDNSKSTDDYKEALTEVLAKKTALVDEEKTVKDAAKQQVTEKLKEKLSEIETSTVTTQEEKDIAKQAAQDEAKKAIDKIDNATDKTKANEARDAGVNQITPIMPVAAVKPAARQAIEDAYTAKVAEIEKRPELTTEEKTAAKAEARKLADAAKANVDKAKTNNRVDTVKASGVDEVDAYSPAGVEKDTAKKAVEAALKAQEKAIDAKADSTTEEKEAAKEEARAKAEAAKEAIDKATSNANVTAAKEAGVGTITPVEPKAEVKPAAKQAIEDAYTAKVAEIEKRPELTTEEKAAAKAEARKLADAARANVDKAKTDDAVAAAEDKGTTKVADVDPAAKAKPAAKAAVDAALAEKDKAIDANDKLSDAEKSAAKEEAKKAADEAKKAIDAAADQAGVDAKATEGTAAVEAVNPVGKDKAKAAVDAALAEKDKAIDANDKLSDAEKSAAKEEAKKAADEAKKAIDAAADQAGVDAKEAEGKAEIAKVTPAAAVEVGKSAAKAEIEKAAKAKEAAIEANDKLSEAAKAAAKAQVAAEAKKAIEAIEKAATEADVEVAKEAGKAEIAKVAPATTDYKAKAKAEVEAELAKKLAELENATDLTEAEKAAAKAQVVNKAKEAIEAIQKAATEADVDQAIRNFVYRISAVIREQEEYDLSKLFVNGSVTVKQGESLTDKDVLSKLNLPSGVEIVKVEKPTTSALGTVMAKVTVKLADGSVEEINVPVEVIVSQNHGNEGNEGNGANNGANNTEAKVNKAKLEGAIHQLDELIIKESAKLDAETAKEANTLLSDAKKVFANADATQAEVDAMVKRIEDFMAKVAPSTDHANTANDQSAQTPAVAPATTQAASNASQTVSAQANARKAAKELPNTGTVNSTVAMVAAAASALLGLGLAGRRRKEDEEA